MSQSPRELAREKGQRNKEQKALLCELLKIVDELDSACDHWQKVEQELEPSPESGSEKLTETQARPDWGVKKVWQEFLERLGKKKDSPQPQSGSVGENLEEVVQSAKEGVEIIRVELLEVLEKQQVKAIKTVGEVFDPQCMYAVGLEATEEMGENRVVKEVVRGYLWQNKVLREAQVIVASLARDS
ncbi:nucleotide exchange factor GrpE [Crocosphaera sp. Alani8]|uniref:nucleotide exchange factor GrpE n=1 Tax=Crocosphaera sp. Alani8 TaxID=3038952 RepID=UPI00313DED11